MNPRPAFVEDDDDVVMLDGPPSPVISRTESAFRESRASSESSCTLRGDSENESAVEAERKRGRLADSRHSPGQAFTRSTTYSFNQKQLKQRSSPEAHRETVSDQAQRRARAANLKHRVPSRAASPVSPPRSSYPGAEFDVREYARLHPEAELEDGCVLIDLEEIAEKMEEELANDALLNRLIASPRRGVQLRNCPIVLPWIEKESVRHGNNTLKPGKTVELDNGHFLYIVDVVQNLESDVVRLRGWELRRCTGMNGVLRKAMNELCFMFEVEMDDLRPMEIQSMVETELDHVVKVRELFRTNYPFPYLRFSESIQVSDDKHTNIQFARDNVRLVVRWKHITKYANRGQRLRNLVYPINIAQKSIQSLTEQECTDGFYLDPLVERCLWRNETISGGSGLNESQAVDKSQASNQSEDGEFPCPVCKRIFRSAEVLFDHYQSLHQRQGNTSMNSGAQLHASRSCSTSRTFSAKSKHVDDGVRHMVSELKFDSPSPKRMYTFADAFCGAGGTTRGASMAGLLVRWGLDKDDSSAKTWRANFPTARHYEMWAHDFKTLDDDPFFSLITDILHLSPPCQVWSPVHARPGKDDEQNFSSLFACEELLKTAKPRIVTLEQTFGILHPKFTPAFNSLIQMFTWHGYSISWQLVNLQQWGLPQSRRRLIILAAAPGETLPELPTYTHSEDPGSGLKPLNSVNSVLAKIPYNAPNHNVAGLLARVTSKIPWDGSGIANCITCNGGTKGHPSGDRSFTDREIAALQTFPLYHQFLGSAIRKQIGNAVPPMIAKLIFRAIIRHLEMTDGVKRQVEILD